MCCGNENHQCGGHHESHQNCSCSCGGHDYSGPMFWTRDEKIAKLEEYLEGLQAEEKSIKERIDLLKKE